MWAVLAVIVFLAGQAYLFHSLGKVDGFLAQQEEVPEKEVLSLAFSDRMVCTCASVRGISCVRVSPVSQVTRTTSSRAVSVVVRPAGWAARGLNVSAMALSA